MSPDHTLVAVGDEIDPEVRVYDVSTGAVLRTLTHRQLSEEFGVGVPFLDFSPDGSMLVVSDSSGTIVFDTTSWEVTHEIVQPDGEEYLSVAWSPDGEVLAIHAANDAVLLYDLGTRLIRTLAAGPQFQGGQSYDRNGLEFTQDGQYLLVAGGQAANMFDISTGRLIGEPFSNEVLHGASIGHGGRALVTGAQDRIYVWRLDPEEWPDLACLAAGRNMTPDEWEQFGWPDEPYNATCPQWPSGADGGE